MARLRTRDAEGTRTAKAERRRPSTSSVRTTRASISIDYASDPEFRSRVQAWVYELWSEKDRLLDQLALEFARPALGVTVHVTRGGREANTRIGSPAPDHAPSGGSFISLE